MRLAGRRGQAGLRTRVPRQLSVLISLPRQSERGEASGPAAVRLFSGSMNWWYLDLGPRGVIFAFGARDAATRLVKYRLRCRSDREAMLQQPPRPMYIATPCAAAVAIGFVLFELIADLRASTFIPILVLSVTTSFFSAFWLAHRHLASSEREEPGERRR